MTETCRQDQNKIKIYCCVWNLKIFCRLLVQHFKLKRISKPQNIYVCLKLFYISGPRVNAITEDSRLSNLLGRESSWRMKYFKTCWILSKVKTRIIKIFLDYFVIFTTCQLTNKYSLSLLSNQKLHLQTIHGIPPLLLQMSLKHYISTFGTWNEVINVCNKFTFHFSLPTHALIN